MLLLVAVSKHIISLLFFDCVRSTYFFNRLAFPLMLYISCLMPGFRDSYSLILLNCMHNLVSQATN